MPHTTIADIAASPDITSSPEPAAQPIGVMIRGCVVSQGPIGAPLRGCVVSQGPIGAPLRGCVVSRV